MGKFKRPTSIPYPYIWHRFQLPDLNDSSKLVNYIIRDLTPNRYEDAIKHLTTYFLSNETLCKSRNLSSDFQSIADFKDVIRSTMINNKLTVACFQEDSDNIIAVNILYVKERDHLDDWNHYNCRNVRDIETTYHYILGQFDVFRHYKALRCLSGFALSVLPQYRQLGIATKVLETNKSIAKMLGLNVITMLLTSTISQKSAEYADYEKNYEITYAKLACKGATFTYLNVEDSTITIHSFRIF